MFSFFFCGVSRCCICFCKVGFELGRVTFFVLSSGVGESQNARREDAFGVIVEYFVGLGWIKLHVRYMREVATSSRLLELV